MISLIAEWEGTFPFCAHCPAAKNCCSRVRPGGPIHTPLLLPSDVQRIESFTGESVDSFCTALASEDTRRRWMRSGANGCHFFRDEKCAIYAVRPLDCRLFPFDIIEKRDGGFVGIAYTRLCPVEFDARTAWHKAKRLVPLLGNDLLVYAQAETPGLDQEPYIELGDVGFDRFALDQSPAHISPPATD